MGQVKVKLKVSLRERPAGRGMDGRGRQKVGTAIGNCLRNSHRELLVGTAGGISLNYVAQRW